jgi:membrane protein
LRSGNNVTEIVKDSLREAIRDDVAQLAAAHAFYTVFSLAPMLLLAVSVAGFVFGREAAREELVAYIAQALNRDMALFVREVLIETRQKLPLATVVGVVSVLFAGSVALMHLRSALNKIWAVPGNEERPVLDFFKQRLFSMLGVFVIGIVLLLAIAASTFAAIASSWVGEALLVPSWLVRAAEHLILPSVATVLFALVYRIVPDVSIHWRDIWMGSLLTAVLFTAGLYLIGLYLSWGTGVSAFGAAGSFFAFLLWVYYSTMVFFLGAEITKVLSRRRSGSRA